MNDSETPNPPHKKPLAPLAIAFAAGVAVALGCVLIGFWMGRRPQPRARVETNSTAPGRMAPVTTNTGAQSARATPQTLAGKDVADSASQTGAHSNVAAGGKARAPMMVPSNAAAATTPGVLVSQAAAAPAPPGVMNPPPKPAFSIEMSPAPTRQAATELVTLLKNLGYNASLAPEDARSRHAFYRIEAGPYASRDDAELALSKMRLEGLHPADVTARNIAPAAPAVAAAKSPGEPSIAPAAADSQSMTKPQTSTGSQTPAGHKTQPPLPVAVANGLAVQVEARQDREGAERLVNRLKSLGYPAFVQAPGPQDHDSLFRVEVGFYATPSDARVVRERLRSKGFRPFIKQPSKSESANADSPPQPLSATHP